MRTRVVFLAALAASLIVAGCAKSPTTPTASAPFGTSGTKSASGNPLVGKWKGSIETPKSGKDDAAAKMAEAFAKMFGDMDLEIKDGDKFAFTVMGIVSEGSITTKDKVMTLTPDHIMGKTIEEFKKINEAAGKTSSADAGKPMSAEVSADGETITVFAADKPDQKMIFKRNTDKPRTIGASTVTPAEAAVVGKYKAEIDQAKIKPEDKQMTEAMLSTSKLSLDQDNTFSMTMLLTLEGTWKVEGDKVTLTIVKALGMDGGDSKQKPVMLTIKDGRLVPQPDDKEAPPVNFVKE